MLVRLRNILVVFLLSNALLINNIFKINRLIYFLALALIILLYFYINLVPVKEKSLSKRLGIMKAGYELIVAVAFTAILEGILYIALLISGGYGSKKILIINIVIAILVIIVSLLNGFVRIVVTSRNLGIVSRATLIFLWWVPIVNIFIFKHCCKKVKYEYFYEQDKELRNESRKESEVCKTKYPIVLVHGIFFRDWMFINYWGRIPKELERNGAEIFYGHQQSSNSVAKSGEELKENILKIIEETGCEKVNIIAHSKGGLDSRYAISALGLSKYVASLTTINTPHRGCKYVDFLLDKIPEPVKNFIAKKYNSIFIKLGDKNPDFLSGVIDLTASKCKEFNKNVLDAKGVLYQSVTSKMKNVFSASFPLNLGYLFAKKFDGENDGLVEVSSAKWGEFLGLLTGKSKGISHGDVIDLTRQDIKGFDVCEFYVNIVKDLKEKNF